MPPKKTAKKARAAKRSARIAKVEEAADGGARSDKRTGELAVVEAIARARGSTRDIMARLHDLIMDAVPGIEPAIKWGMPVYSTEDDGMVCYVAPYDAYVRFGFYHARSRGLDGLDAGQGDGGHVKYARAADVDAARVKAWLRAATTPAQG